MENRLRKEQILCKLDDLKISKGEFTVLASAALTIRGVLKDAGDIDIAVSKRGFDELDKNYKLEKRGNGWYKVTDEVECIIDDMVGKKEPFRGIYLQDIYDYLNYIEHSKREKDYRRIPLVKDYIEKYYEM